MLRVLLERLDGLLDLLEPALGLQLVNGSLNLILGAAPKGTPTLILVVLSHLGAQMTAARVDHQEQPAILRAIHLNEVVAATQGPHLPLGTRVELAHAAVQVGEPLPERVPTAARSAPGTEVQAGDEVAELESSKAVTPLVAPVAGVIRYVNNEAADDPSIVTGDPYGEGWIFKIELEDDEPGLLSSEEYANIVAQ